MYDLETMLAVRDNAEAAGQLAVSAMSVNPMIVEQPGRSYYVADGVCGFAWVDITPKNKGNTTLGKQERKILECAGFRKDWTGKKYNLWISGFNQSMQKKEAYAHAYAEVLRKAGLNAYAGSRMD